MALNRYIAYGLTGGATGDLDAIDGDDLVDLDQAWVQVSGFVYHYALNASSGAAESSPDIIAPDTNPGTKRWILNPVYGVVLEADFDANTILAATSDNTPVTLTVGEQTFIGRITAGNIAALTPAQGRTLFDVSASGDVILKVFIAAKGDLIGASGNDTPLILSIGTNDFVLTADSGEASGMKWATPAAPVAHDLAGAEHNSDTLADLNTKISDGTLVDTASIVLKALFDAHTIIYSVSDNTPVALTVGASTIVGRGAAGNIVALTAAQVLTIINVEDGAQVNPATLADLNTLIADATLDDSGDSRTPSAHDLAGALHNADTLADLNSKINDATIVDTGAIILKAFMAAKGDLIGASANDTPIILTVGTNGYRLVADSGEASGLKWEVVPTASVTVSGEVELATTDETNTGTDATRAVTPDGLAGSIHGTKTVVIKVIADDTTLTTGDGKTHFTVPIELNGMDLVSVGAHVYTVSSSGLPTIQIHNLTDTVDMLTTEITIDETEKDSKDAVTPAVIDGTNDDVVTGDEIRIDVDIAGTGTAGLEVRLGFRTP